MRLCSIFKHLCPFRLVTLRDSTRHDSIRFDIDSSSARPVMSLPCPAVPFIAPFVSVSRTTCASRSQRAMAAAVQLAPAPRSSVHVGNVSTFRFDSFRFVSFRLLFITFMSNAMRAPVWRRSIPFGSLWFGLDSEQSAVSVDADVDVYVCGCGCGRSSMLEASRYRPVPQHQHCMRLSFDAAARLPCP